MAEQTTIYKNIYIFHGEDDFSLRQKVRFWKAEFSKKYSGTSIIEINNEGLGEIELAKKFEEMLTPSLFSSKKLIIARNCLPSKASQEILMATFERVLKIVLADYFLIFWQDSLDRRLGFTKKLLKEVNVLEFHLPHGLELNSWIRSRAAQLGLSLDLPAIERLAVLTGRDLYEEKKVGGRVIERKEVYDLWQVNSELEKLTAYSATVNAKEVDQLVVGKFSENVFDLSDAIVAQNKKAALEILEKLMQKENTDEKSMAIKLLGLIAEQVRSLLLVNILKSQNMDQNQIAQFLGWSAGRVFITSKNSAKAKPEALRKMIKRILEADSLVKSSDTNPKLLIDLLIAA